MANPHEPNPISHVGPDRTSFVVTRSNTFYINGNGFNGDRITEIKGKLRNVDIQFAIDDSFAESDFRFLVRANPQAIVITSPAGAPEYADDPLVPPFAAQGTVTVTISNTTTGTSTTSTVPCSYSSP